ncbi:UPF0481 protein [Spatholobus suberectus]|nr:UPF0481 protein [Spatholobus suberectus]
MLPLVTLQVIFYPLLCSGPTSVCSCHLKILILSYSKQECLYPKRPSHFCGRYLHFTSVHEDDGGSFVYISGICPFVYSKDRKRDLMGSAVQYHIQHIINIPEEIEPALWPECCIYKVPTSLLKVKEVAYTPLLISIGPVHHNKEELKEMQEQKHRYFHFFWGRLENKLDLVHYKAFLEQEEQKLRRCYQKKFPKINKEQFVEMMLLDAVFIMELFLREAKKWEHKDDYLITQGCVSKSIQCDLMLLENQLPMIVLEKLYDRVVPCNVKKHTRFINLAHEYFRSYYPHEQSSENNWLDLE